MLLIVEEELLDALPNGTGSDIWSHDNIKDLHVDGRIELGQDNEVHLDPLGVVKGSGGAVDMVSKAVLVEGDRENVAPLGEVGCLEVENDRYMRLDRCDVDLWRGDESSGGLSGDGRGGGGV